MSQRDTRLEDTLRKLDLLFNAQFVIHFITLPHLFDNNFRFRTFCPSSAAYLTETPSLVPCDFERQL